MNEWEWNLLENKPPIDSVEIDGVVLKTGDTVRLKPRAGGDVMDLALADRIATIDAIEQDYEGTLQLAVVLDDDPGRDLGVLRQPGHRFFFRPSEVEAVPHVLIAGIGNIFFGDDAFGVHVAQRLQSRTQPSNVRVEDFGIRGFDLACALVDGPDIAVLVDACPRGSQPGTIHVIEPDSDGLDGGAAGVEAHGLNPMNVLRLAASMEGRMGRVLIVGCEPESLGGEDGRMALSAPVTAAVDDAVAVIESLVAHLGRSTREP
jgi:hydrogenase maturation protease